LVRFVPKGWGPSPSVLILVYAAFPRSDYCAPSDFPERHWTFIRLSPSYFHRPYQPSWDLPCSHSRTQRRWFRWRVLFAPSALCGSRDCSQGRVRLTCDTLSSTSGLLEKWSYSFQNDPKFRLSRWHLRQGLSGSTFPEGRCTLRV